MTDHDHSTVADAVADHVHDSAPDHAELENFAEETKNNEMVAKAATIVVVGAGVALLSAELLPGMLIGVCAAFLPGVGHKLRPLFKSTVRAGYSAVRKTRELVAEAKEQVQDVVAEARADHESKAESSPSSKPAASTTAA